MISGLSYARAHCIWSASAMLPSYQPMYSFKPSTSRYSPRGSLRTWRSGVGRSTWFMADVIRRVESAARASSASLWRKVVLGGDGGVSLDNDQNTTDARF